MMYQYIPLLKCTFIWGFATFELFFTRWCSFLRMTSDPIMYDINGNLYQVGHQVFLEGRRQPTQREREEKEASPSSALLRLKMLKSRGSAWRDPEYAPGDWDNVRNKCIQAK